MMKRLLLGFPLALAFLWAASCAVHEGVPLYHPEELTEAPLCSDCHSDEWPEALDHTPTYETDHGYQAARWNPVCQTCHSQAFCADCHGYEEELKPSDKIKDQPWRNAPHRGDYLSQHRIDGRINPAPCFKCHGRRNDRTCRECHR